MERLIVVPAPPGDEELARAAGLARALVSELRSSVRAPETVLESAVACLLAGGHLMVEDVPGVGKTVLAKSLARASGCAFARLQCTADLLPSDVTGVHVFDQRTQGFEFRPGPVFANVVLADEINRASPKTQSALLECMEEGQVTVDGHTRRLPRPFMVVATLNPVEYEGTFPLPEAQLDRFAVRLRIGYPPPADEAAMLLDLSARDALDAVRPVADEAALRAAIATTAAVHADPVIARYVVDIAEATREDGRLVLGASPRAALTLLRVARATALVGGQTYVSPEHVKRVAPSVLAHRLVLGPEARVAGLRAEDVVAEALGRARVPLG
ncbi:MAG TPA: MoxR family ATPase [Miltoncostaeaceae bacterium]|nr:MoxR family ATPase [Miltoncostaeaceae bacterium]